MTRNEALQIANNKRKNINFCEEWKYAYIFGNTDDADDVGGIGPVVVMKDTGECVNWSYYNMNAPEDDELMEEYTIEGNKWVEEVTH